jgi:excisionase family DNA binding protein
MYLSVQQAARKLGVSPVTIRRWTATGFLPCTRTAGGHRRIDDDDIDELARAIGGSNHLAAQLAREREVETLVRTAAALSSQLDLHELLAEIAHYMTGLLDADFCAVSAYERETQTVRVLADYDKSGRRLPDTGPYRLRDFPATRKVLDEQAVVLVNVDDPHADPAEVAMLRRDGDRCLLMVPLVVGHEAIGLLEIQDHLRTRQFSRQELRLCNAIAGQAAVALQNATLFAASRRSDRDIAALREALAAVARSAPGVIGAATPNDLLTELARLVCDALGAISCVVNARGQSAGAFTTGASGAEPGGTSAAVIVAADPGPSGLTIAVTLSEPAGEGVAELLDLVAVSAGAALARLATDASATATTTVAP